MTEPGLPKGLTLRRKAAGLVLWVERVWPKLWPPLGVAGLFVCAALLGLPRLLPPLWHAGLLAVVAAAVIGLAWKGLRQVRAPDAAAADRRLERDAGLDHHPLSVLADRPVQSDPATLAVWRAHRARMTAQLGRLRVGWPRPGLARFDRRALRFGLVLAIVALVVVAGEQAPTRMAAAIEPALPAGSPAVALELHAWITPPAYTRQPPVFLKANGAVSVPAGSHLIANVSGTDDPPQLLLDGKPETFRALDANSFQADRDLTAGGRLVIRRGVHDLGAWNLTVVADQPPVTKWSALPGRQGSGLQTRLPWEASDDYGVVGLQAELRLDARPAAPAVVVPLAVAPGQPKAAHGVAQQDLTAHPWAGLKVIGHLVAEDAIGQTGTSAEAVFDLPERPFRNPIARVLIALRKTLSLHPDDRDDALIGLDQLMLDPSAFGDDRGGWVNLSAIYSLLARERSEAAVPQAQERLWELALHLEEGRAEQTARALEEARRAAREAMDKAASDPGRQQREALEERLKELQQAIDRHMQALQEDAQRNGQLQPFDPDAQTLSSRELDRMAEQAREAARQGRMEEAKRRMADLERLLDQLRSAQAQGSKDSKDSQSNTPRQRGRQQMSAVQDMVGREGHLMDHAGRRGETPLQLRPTAPHAAGPNGGPPDPAAQREADRRVQQALRRALGELMQEFGDLTGEVPPSLTDADKAMREAGQRLAEGHDQAAGAAQQQAIEALQKGTKEMGQSMARQFGQGRGNDRQGNDGQGNDGQGGEAEDGSGEEGYGMMQPGEPGDRFGTAAPQPGGAPDRADPGGRDPLGRRAGQGHTGSDESTDAMVPEERERQRSQAIQEELRQRGADRGRPQQELEYIDRLLRQF